jgi:gliding motility-associated-like protein
MHKNRLSIKKIILLGYLLLGVLNNANSQCWKNVVTGDNHSLSIREDGTLWAWGFNAYGQIGDGTTTQRPTPLQIGTANNWKMVSAGTYYSMGIKMDGTLWAWGYNLNGQLGDGTTTNRSVPTQIGSATDWNFVNLGGSHTIAIKTNGTLWTWGANAYGQLGDGTTVDKYTPAQVGAGTNWKSGSGGDDFSLVIQNNGTLWGFGRNNFGELGDGTTVQKTVPTQITGATNWLTVECAQAHALALKTDGTLWSWGYSFEGGLGLGAPTNVTIPNQVGALTNWKSIGVQYRHSMATKTDGTLWCFGYNANGQLGDGTTVNRNVPTQIGASTNWSSVAPGNTHSNALQTNASLWGTGTNSQGQFGDGTTANTTSFVMSLSPQGVANASVTPTLICPGGTATLTAYGILTLDQGSVTGSTTGFWASLSEQQTFVPSFSGMLKKVRVHTATYASSTNITLKIFSGSPGTGSQLTSVVYFKPASTNSWDDVLLPPGVSLSSGLPYYIEILAGSQVDWIYNGTNVYALGNSWRGGTSYNYDYNFETYMDLNSYQWNPGALSIPEFTASPGSTTNYTATITNGTGCVNIKTVTLNVNPIINAPTVITNVSCNGGTNGAIDLSPSGGTPPYIYAWSNGPTTQDITNLVPGSYNVMITDANGCTKPTSGIVNQPALLIASSAITTSINCNGGTGVVSVSASGGTPSYTGMGSFTVTAGTYTYTVTDANGCVKTTTINVSQPAPLTINVNAAVNICLGGTANLSATGASTYTWNPGGLTGANVAVSPVSTTVYTATGTSSLGCVATNTTTVTVNPNPTVTVSSSTICVGATTTLTASSATTYSWSTGGTTASIAVSPGSTTNYTVTGTNGFGCTNTKTTSVMVNLLPTITTSASPTSICVGANSNLTAAGATTYTWNPGGLMGPAVTVSPASTTVYTVTGTNGNGCINTQTINLTVNSLPVVTAASSSTAICVGSSATLTGGGATTYTWNPGTLTGSTTVVSPGSTTQYTVTGTSAFGCVDTQTINLTVNPLPTLTLAASPATMCVGATSTLTGTGAASYTWNPGGFLGAVIIDAPSSSTQYTVTGTNGNGCVNTQTINLTVNPLPTLTVIASPTAICVGSTATLTGSGATTYTWNPGALTGSATVVSPGSTTQYTVTGTNGNGCVNSQTVNLTVNVLPTLTTSASPATICVGATSTLTGSGATTYTWNPGALTGASISVSPGSTTIYTVTGTNGNGCVNTKTVNLTVNPLPTLTVAASPATICVGATSTLTGTGATSYTWNPGALTGASISVSPGSTTIYTVTGTNGNGCVNTKTVNLTVNPLPTLTVAASPATICVGATSTLTGAGATTYTWNPGALTGAVTIVSPGTTTQYTVTGANGNGCVNTKTLNVTVNPLPTLTVIASPTAICVGATATLTGTGATTYTWNPGALTGANVSVSPGSTTIYTVTGINSNGCVNTQTVNLTVNSLPTLTVAASSTAICAGETATLTGNGATSYTWNPGGLTGSVISVNPASITIYTVTGTNGSGCVQTETISLTVNALPVVTAATTSSAICAGETATLTAGGAVTYLWDNGASTAVVTVAPGSLTIYTVTGTDGNNCVNSETVSITVNALPVIAATSSPTAICAGATATLTGTGATSYTWQPGSLTGASVFVNPTSTIGYTVTGADGNGCVGTQTVDLTVNALPIVTAVSSPTAICVGATATLTAIGANSYLWDTGANTSMTVVSPASSTIYTVTGTDGNGCVNTETVSLTVNSLPVITAMSSPTAICAGETATLTAVGASTYLWDTGANTAMTVVSPVSSTIYTLIGTDGNNCVNTETVSITVNALPVITAMSSPTAICAGATATLTGTGATSYTWQPGSLTGTSAVVNPTSTTIYTVTGANGSGCVQTETISLTVNALPVVTANSTASVICSGQSVTLNGSGAVSYAWNNGVVDGVAFIPGASGSYIVTGMDVNGCIGTDTTFVTVNSLPLIVAGSTSTAVCSGNFISLTGSGALTYTWNPGALTGATVSVNPSSNTVYTLSGTDGAGCVNTETISLTVNSLPVVTATSSPVGICAGQTSTLTAAGAVSYTWNPGTLTGVAITVSPSSTTVYTVTGVDGSGCVNTGSVSLSVSMNPTVTVVSSPSVICEGQTATLTASGAATYSWNTGANTFSTSVSPTSTSVYTVTGTNGMCTNTETISLTVNINPTVTIAASPSAICIGQTSTLTASGANTYVWSTSAVTSAIIVSPASTTVYTVTGTNTTNCTHTETVSLTINPLPAILVSPSNTTICQGQLQLLQASGATTYTWSGNGSVSNSITVSPTVATIYTVTGMDANSCVNTATAIVNTVSQPVVSINSPSTNVCMGYTMTVVASGASNYSWSNGATTSSITVQPFSNITYSVIGSNGGACPDTAFFPITILPLPSVSASANNTLICAGNTVSLTAGGSAVNFLWQPGNLLGANQAVQMNAPTTFTVYGQGSNGCAFFSTTFVDVPSPSAITPVVTPTAICVGDSAILSVSGATISLWSSNPVPNTSVVMPFNNTTYTFSAVDVNGCTSDVFFTVLMRLDCDEVVVYNGFTPNGDGINDVWLIDNIEKFPNNKVFIYNRWGNAIFHTTNYNNADNSWDGKLNGQVIDPGTYFYIIVDESEKLIKKGWLEITN